MGDAPIDPVPVVDVGVTSIGDLYCHADRPIASRRPVVGYFDLCEATAYVIEHEIDGLCRLMNAERLGSLIRTTRGRGYVDYGVRDLRDLDFHRPIEECDMAVVADFECQAQTGCIPLIKTRTGAPDGSFQAPPGGVTICARMPGARCVEMVRRRVVNLYANQDCTPEPPTPTPRNLALCSID
jgi:hypothetical protein